jgi:hypothetical protein
MWRTIPDYPRYEAHPSGQIRSKMHRKPLRMYLHKGYPAIQVRLSGGKKKRLVIHRLVALTFIPNPAGAPTVNHINGVKTDNRVENLEWMTVQENNKHAWDTGLMTPKPAKPVQLHNPKTGTGHVCFNGKQIFAAGFNAGNVSYALNHPRPVLGGAKRVKGHIVTKLASWC